MRAPISAVILAAGRGTRLQTSIPKAYLTVGSKPMLSHSLERFAQSDLISEIVVVLHPEDRKFFQAVPAPPKPVKIVYGGAQRQDSALAGVRAATGDYVLVHDAARPLVSRKLIERVIEGVSSHRAVVPVVPITESVKYVREGQVLSDLNRSKCFGAQTPQGFERALLLESLEQACREKRYFTDESSAVLAILGVHPQTIPGEETNIKITTATDLQIAECLLSRL